MRTPGIRPYCLLTFDDGKRSNATKVAPVLQEMGIPAVFYVCTGSLSTGELLWFDEYAAIRRAFDVVPADLQWDAVVSQPYSVIRDRLYKTRQVLGIELDSDDDDIRPMNWDDARSLAEMGYTIGAHGVSHAILPFLPEEDAKVEIIQSIEDVSRQIGSSCKTFAFPNGNYTDELGQLALKAGAATAMTTEPRWVDGKSEPSRLPRIQLSRSHSKAMIATKLAVVATGCVLKNSDGSGRAYLKRVFHPDRRIIR